MGVVRRFLRPGQTLPPTLSIVDDSTLKVNLVADDPASYSGSGTSWTNLGTFGTPGNMFIGSGVTYDSNFKAFKYSSSTDDSINMGDVSPLTQLPQQFSTRGGSVTFDAIGGCTHEFWIYINGSLNADGTINILQDAVYNLQLATIFKPSTLTTTNGNFRFILQYRTDDVINIENSTTVVSAQNGSEIQQQPLDGWYHIVVTGYTSPETVAYLNTFPYPSLKTYVNGNFVAGEYSEYPGGGFYQTISGYKFDFGNNDFYRLNTFRIYDRVLTDAEILQNYQATESNFSPKGFATADLLI